MSLSFDSIEQDFEEVNVPAKGSNFLVSAVMILRRQRLELQQELKKLQERVQILEAQNAGLLNLGADRLLRK
jgi:cell division protein FtsB